VNNIFLLGEPVVLESSTKDVEFHEGDSVTLICNAQGLLLLFLKEKEKIISFSSGYPTPKIEWQKADARPLSSGHIRQLVCILKLIIPFYNVFLQGSQLHLTRVTSRDSGIYKCLGL
jgi:hypothetical protein